MQSVQRIRIFLPSALGLLRLGLPVLLLLVGCSSDSNVVLISGIRSGITWDQTQQAVDLRAANWSNVETTQLKAGDLRSPYKLDVWETAALTVGGVSGVTRFQFFNGRLMSIEFFPTLPEKFDASVTGTSATVAVGKDYRGRSYVRFEDKRIKSELDAWIRKHS